MKYFLGIDLGSSTVKVSIIEADSGKRVAFASSPNVEMEIVSNEKSWAEQDPNVWWSETIKATHEAVRRGKLTPQSIAAIGISYQMHGLVLVDKDHEVIRPAIIWCDSRAIEIGSSAYHQLGEQYCMGHLLNSPGNFTASKLKWVQQYEPRSFERIYKAMLPGDFLAMKMTGRISTTITGLSEAIMWDYKSEGIPERLFDYYSIDKCLMPEALSSFGEQGWLSEEAASQLGLLVGTPISYRSGDQPNNAFSLKALNPGEMATTAGTSGVIYGVVAHQVADPLSRVNSFIHVNHKKDQPRYGVLMCVNGTGSMNGWLRRNFFSFDKVQPDYQEINMLAAQTPIGADKLCVLPFGNGAERILLNKEIGASIHGLQLNRHTTAHVCRAVQEGIVYALGYGFEIMNKLGMKTNIIRAGDANMFLSPLFCEAFVNVTGTRLELFNTDGSQGAARGAGVGVGHFKTIDEAFETLACIKTYEPDPEKKERYQQSFHEWKGILHHQLKANH